MTVKRSEESYVLVWRVGLEREETVRRAHGSATFLSILFGLNLSLILTFVFCIYSKILKELDYCIAYGRRNPQISSLRWEGWMTSMPLLQVVFMRVVDVIPSGSS